MSSLFFPLLQDQSYAHYYANAGCSNSAPKDNCPFKSHAFPPSERCDLCSANEPKAMLAFILFIFGGGILADGQHLNLFGM
jgi:hypothetical protein